MPLVDPTHKIKENADKDTYMSLLDSNRKILLIYFFMEWIFIIPLSIFIYMAWEETSLGVIILAAIALLVFFHVRKVRQIYSVFYKYFARIVYKITVDENVVKMKTRSFRFLWVYFPSVELESKEPIIYETDDFPNFRIKPLDKVYIILTEHGPMYVHRSMFSEELYDWLKINKT